MSHTKWLMPNARGYGLFALIGQPYMIWVADQVGVGKPDWDNGQEFKKLVPRLNLVNRNFECPFLVYFEDF